MSLGVAMRHRITMVVGLKNQKMRDQLLINSLIIKETILVSLGVALYLLLLKAMRNLVAQEAWVVFSLVAQL